MDPNGLADRL